MSRAGRVAYDIFVGFIVSLLFAFGVYVWIWRGESVLVFLLLLILCVVLLIAAGLGRRRFASGSVAGAAADAAPYPDAPGALAPPRHVDGPSTGPAIRRIVCYGVAIAVFGCGLFLWVGVGENVMIFLVADILAALFVVLGSLRPASTGV